MELPDFSKDEQFIKLKRDMGIVVDRLTCAICLGPIPTICMKDTKGKEVVVWPHGNSTHPIEVDIKGNPITGDDPRCCDHCDCSAVIPTRLRLPQGSEAQLALSSELLSNREAIRKENGSYYVY